MWVLREQGPGLVMQKSQLVNTGQYVFTPKRQLVGCSNHRQHGDTGHIVVAWFGHRQGSLNTLRGFSPEAAHRHVGNLQWNLFTSF